MIIFRVVSAALLISCFLTGELSGQTSGTFDVRFDDSGLTTDQRNTLAPFLTASENFWESVIVGYQDGITLDGIDIQLAVGMIDGPDGEQANASVSGTGFNQGGFTFITDSDTTSSVATITFDIDDFGTGSDESFGAVVNHEVGHSLGFISLLFDQNGLLGGTGQYTGSEGLAAYQAEFDAAATFVPLEPDDSHLAEDNTLLDLAGRSASDGLLTPILFFGPDNSPFLTQTTAAVFRDLGFVTVLPVSVPEPSAATVCVLATISCVLRRRRTAS